MMRPLLSLLCCAALLRAEDELPPACDPADAGGPTAPLRGGATIPQVGLGTWQSAPGEVGAAVRAALRAGYRHLDCAAVYGNEKEIGAVLGELVGDGPGQIPRGELFVTSKLFNSEHAPTDVRPALEQTLADLQLDYLDLYLIHWPQAFAKVEGTHAGRPTHQNVRTPSPPAPFPPRCFSPRRCFGQGSMVYDFETSTAATWGAMEACQQAGLTRGLGLSNFNQRQIAELEAVATIKPAVLQVESHPFFAQESLLKFCLERGIVFEAYSPLAAGGRSKRITARGCTNPRRHPSLLLDMPLLLRHADALRAQTPPSRARAAPRTRRSWRSGGSTTAAPPRSPSHGRSSAAPWSSPRPSHPSAWLRTMTSSSSCRRRILGELLQLGMGLLPVGTVTVTRGGLLLYSSPLP